MIFLRMSFGPSFGANSVNARTGGLRVDLERAFLISLKTGLGRSQRVNLFLLLMTIPVQLLFVFVLSHLFSPFLDHTSHNSLLLIIP